MNIIEFLDARLAEDEALARDAIAALDPTDLSQEWVWGTPREHYGGGYFNREGMRTIWHSTPQSRHMNAHSPERVIRDVAAKRELIATLTKRIEEGWGRHGNEGIIERDLRPMAEVYSDHPEFAAIEWE